MAISLKRLEQKKLQLGINKLANAGLDVGRWLAMCDASAAEMRRLVDLWPLRRPSFCYDAAPILGLGEASREPLPDPSPGEVIVRVGAWSLQDLRTCETVVRHRLMWCEDWYDVYPFSCEKLTPGAYRVRMPIPDSNHKYFTEQCKLLLSGEEAAPAALVAVTLLCSLKQAGKDPLQSGWTRCAEPLLPGEDRVALYVNKSCVHVRYYWHNHRGDSVWLVGCRKS
jgi:hypothetical protein